MSMQTQLFFPSISSQDNGDNQGVGLTNILQLLMHISCHTKKTNALKTLYFIVLPAFYITVKQNLFKVTCISFN